MKTNGKIINAQRLNETLTTNTLWNNRNNIYHPYTLYMGNKIKLSRLEPLGLPLPNYRHFLEQIIRPIYFLHDPEHVAGVQVDCSCSAGVEVPIGIDAFKRTVEQ